jgi:NADH-quinone oxidoreductase subunit E
MAVRRLAEKQPETFAFTPENLEWAKAKIREYPEGRQASAVIPILWRAQEQSGGWLPEPAIRLVAELLEMPYIRVYEIATFYTMFQLQPVGTVAHIGVCGTTPCMLRGSGDLVRICKERIAPQPLELSPDGRFSWEEVECAGACVNAPMIQIGPDTYEDLTPERFHEILDALDRGERPAPGPQSGRKASEPITGATTLTTPVAPVVAEGEAVAVSEEPTGDVSPASPAAHEQQAARPVPRDRTDVEATRTTQAPPEPPSPIAPDPSTNGRPLAAPDAAAKQKPATAPGQAPSAPEAPAQGGEPALESEREVAPGEPDRAAPGATFAERPLKDESEARITPAAASPAPRADEGANVSAPPAPDAAAAERADAEGVRPAGYRRGEMARVDDLQKISGIGPKLERTLHDLGIFSFEQIAGWTEENKAWVNAYLAFRGRIDRERWVEQARALQAVRDGATD